MNIIKFGKALIETEDLDPIYTMLWRAKLPEKKLYRWLLAYWFFYHAGVASKLSEYKGRMFFAIAVSLIENPKTPRGTERRHFRGIKALDCIRYFNENFNSATQAVYTLIKQDANDVNGIVSIVSNEWPMFGPWMGFKIADMLERLGLKQISFPYKTLKMYRDPMKGAQLFLTENPDQELGIHEVVTYLVKQFKDYKAPPRYERYVNAQEVETILCKWKSHRNGHYEIGKDTNEIYHGLKGWGKTARKLRKILKPKLKEL